VRARARCLNRRRTCRGPRSARLNNLTSLPSHTAPEERRSWIAVRLLDETRWALWKAAAAFLAPQALTYTGLLARRLLMHKVSGARRIEQRWMFIAKNQRDGLPRGLTFEVSGRRRLDAKPELAKMYRVPPAWAWWPAGGAPLDRGVRRHRSHGLDSEHPLVGATQRVRDAAVLADSQPQALRQ
jgi:hypothetical protein